MSPRDDIASGALPRHERTARTAAAAKRRAPRDTSRRACPGAGARAAVIFVAFAAALAVAFAPAARGAELEVVPARSRVDFTLGATLHTVKGSAKVVGGTLQLDEATGTLAGEVRVDARSAETGNASRDRDMHEKVLLSAQHPTIVLRPRRWRGALPGAGRSEGTLEGTLELLGREHAVSAPVTLEPNADGWLATARLRVPYVEWGLRDPSKAFLRVDPYVDVVAVALVRRR